MEEKLIINDYERLEDNKYELIDDIICILPSPSISHNRLIFNLAKEFDSYLCNKKCSVEITPNVFYDNSTNYVIPDVAIMCEPEKFRFDGYYGVPTLIIEVLSTNSEHDLVTKFNLYEKIGVKEYWIIHPVEQYIIQYSLLDGKYYKVEKYNYILSLLYAVSDKYEQAQYKEFINSKIFPDLKILLADLFFNVSIF